MFYVEVTVKQIFPSFLPVIQNLMGKVMLMRLGKRMITLLKQKAAAPPWLPHSTVQFLAPKVLYEDSAFICILQMNPSNREIKSFLMD